MAVIVNKGNPYVAPMAFQIKDEDFTSILAPYKKGGIIVDIINRRTFRGIVHINTLGKIEKIEERDDVPETTYILPGFIDSHVHIESSMLMPTEFAFAAVKHGVVAAICDPHEIANVLGVDGVEYFIENGKQSPFKFFFGAPSCVPAAPFETSGAIITSKEIEKLMASKDIYFLAEMMNFPGVVNGDSEVLAKIEFAKKFGKPIDGHSPGLAGKKLKIYADAGISTDHECMSICEAEDKIGHGMKVLVREGSAARNFEALYPIINQYPDMVMLCTDDSHPDSLEQGYINSIIKRGLNKDLNIYNLLQAACLNPVEHYKIPVGLLREGDSADFIVTDSLDEKFEVLETFIGGKQVYANGKVFLKRPKIEIRNNFNISNINKSDLEIEAKSDNIKLIEVIDKEIYTRKGVAKAKVNNGKVVSNTEDDVLKIVVQNRYNNAKPMVSFIKGFGLKNGAIASTVAHDSHNIIAVGANDDSLYRAISAIIKHKGGICVYNEETLDLLALPIAGIISDRGINEVAKDYRRLEEGARALGSKLSSPFMTLSFMGLIVIPELKICDKGLFDVNKFNYTDIFEK